MTDPYVTPLTALRAAQEKLAEQKGVLEHFHCCERLRLEEIIEELDTIAANIAYADGDYERERKAPDPDYAREMAV